MFKNLQNKIGVDQKTNAADSTQSKLFIYGQNVS